MMRRLFFPVALIALAVASRLLPHTVNFTPLGAMTLFSGYYFKNRNYGLLPLLALALSDFLLSGYYGPVMFYVYGSFGLTFLVGRKFVSRNPVFSRVMTATLLSASLFFLITNFAVWAHSNLYPKTWWGLVESYWMALPFFRNSLLGDLLYGSVFFAAYTWAKRTQHQPSPLKIDLR